MTWALFSECVQLCSEKPSEALVSGKLPLTDSVVTDFPALLNLGV